MAIIAMTYEAHKVCSELLHSSTCIPLRQTWLWLLEIPNHSTIGTMRGCTRLRVTSPLQSTSSRLSRWWWWSRAAVCGAISRLPLLDGPGL